MSKEFPFKPKKRKKRLNHVSIEVSDKNMKEFENIKRKYGWSKKRTAEGIINVYFEHFHRDNKE